MQRCASSPARYGFTLFELLVVLALIAALSAWGLPNFQAFHQRNGQTAAVHQLQSALALARHSAITLNADVFLCPQAADKSACGSDWSRALLVVAHSTQAPLEPANVLRVLPRVDARITYNRGWKRVRFSALGQSRGHNGTFTICAAGTASARGTALVLSQLGRLRIQNSPADCP